MYIVAPPSCNFDPSDLKAPEHFGGVAWTAFNRSFHALQGCPWWRVNRLNPTPLHWRPIRLALAWYIQRIEGYTGLQEKADAFARLRPHLPTNPNVVFFGAEAGWEAFILQAIVGDRGRVCLIDADEGARERYHEAKDQIELRATWNSDAPTLQVHRKHDQVDYRQENLFEIDTEPTYDIGIDWGLLEHYPGQDKQPLMKRMQTFIRPGGFQISSVPKNSLGNRIFYRAFANELNYGYRELLDREEFHQVLTGGGYQVIDTIELLDSYIVLSKIDG